MHRVLRYFYSASLALICAILAIQAHADNSNPDLPEPFREFIRATESDYQKIMEEESTVKLTPAPTTLFIKVVDEGGMPVQNVITTVGKTILKTDLNGVACFENILLNEILPFSLAKTGFISGGGQIWLAPENWGPETYKGIVMRRMEQFHIQMSYDIEDPLDVPANNGDRKANAGESIRIPIVVNNKSTEVTARWIFEVESDSDLLELSPKKLQDLAPLKPGEGKRFLIPAKVIADINQLEIARIKASVTPVNDALGIVTAELPLPLHTGEPLALKLLNDPVITDPDKGELASRNNGNGLLGPGELGFLKLTVGNIGPPVKGIVFDVQSIPPSLLPEGAIKRKNIPASGLELKTNQMIEPSFIIDLPRNYAGPVLPLKLRARSQGRTWETQFALPLEGREDFHATLEIHGRLARGTLCNYTARLRYSGSYFETRAVVELSTSNPKVSIRPASFYQHVITPGKTEEFKGMISVPADTKGKEFTIIISVLDRARNNLCLFQKSITCQLEE